MPIHCFHASIIIPACLVCILFGMPSPHLLHFSLLYCMFQCILIAVEQYSNFHSFLSFLYLDLSTARNCLNWSTRTSCCWSILRLHIYTRKRKREPLSHYNCSMCRSLVTKLSGNKVIRSLAIYQSDQPFNLAVKTTSSIVVYMLMSNIEHTTVHILQFEQHCLYDFFSLRLASNKHDGVYGMLKSFIITSKVLVLLTCTVLPYLEHAMGKNAMVRHGALVLFSISLPS